MLNNFSDKVVHVSHKCNRHVNAKQKLTTENEILNSEQLFVSPGKRNQHYNRLICTKMFL